jgi:hypothetical protein
MNPSVSHLDWAIILIHLLGVVGLGVAAWFLRRKGGPGGERGITFLRAKRLPGPSSASP